MSLTLTHRLILPTDANHYGTLYAGSLLRITLEAAYATAWQEVGVHANLVLRRVLNLECYKPVQVGSVIGIQGAVLHKTKVYLVTGLVGMPLKPGEGPWMEALLGFAQVDSHGHLAEIPDAEPAIHLPNQQPWDRLTVRLNRLLRLRQRADLKET